MSKENKRFTFKNFDFGFNPDSGDEKEFKLPSFWKKKTEGDASLPRPPFSFKSFIRKSARITHQKFSKIKWKVSRSIFLGRGIYFKYISHLSIIIIVIFGTFVYLGYYSKDHKAPFLSKYARAYAEVDSTLRPQTARAAEEQKLFGTIKYKVNSGDTFSSIALKFSTDDNKISTDSIAWANPDIKENSLSPGMVLEIPSVSGTLHTVQKGENIVDIARKYGKIKPNASDIEIFAALQEITEVNLLEVKIEGDKKIPEIVEGQKIIIPGGVIVPQPLASQGAVGIPKNIPIPKPQNSIVGSGALCPGLRWPIAGGAGVITQFFTSRVYGYGHTGYDIADPTGPFDVAVGSGVVTSASWENSVNGAVVRIRLDNGCDALYAHLLSGSFLVRKGDRVAIGQPIARMGSSGRSTGTHTHFELWKDGGLLNPGLYIGR